MQKDLFDQAGAKGMPGERQTDLEDLIPEYKIEDSLAYKIAQGDRAGADAWVAEAKAGKIMRIM